MVVTIKAEALGIQQTINADEVRIGYRRIYITNACGRTSLSRVAGFTEDDTKVFYDMEVDGIEVCTHGDDFKRTHIYVGEDGTPVIEFTSKYGAPYGTPDGEYELTHVVVAD